MGARGEIVKKTTIFFALVFYSIIGVSKDKMTISPTNDKAIVYFYGFSIERITGLHENEIEKYGDLFIMTKDSFDRSRLVLPNQKNDLKYNGLDIRGKVIFRNEEYFIDRSGVFKGPRGIGKIDKFVFETFLEPIEKNEK